MDHGYIPPAKSLLGSIQFVFQPGKVAVLKLCGLFEIPLPLCYLDLVIDGLYLFAQLGKPSDTLLFGIPFCLVIPESFVQLRDVSLQLFQTLL